MGIEPVNYGSIFLFKNGFRVYPFGNKGDDSWGLDYRAQQRYNSRLGTRDLFGKVEINTDDNNEFKEVSSRDGGLVKTDGSKQLFDAFEKSYKKLEDYVSGVLWGTDFIKEAYFENEEIARQHRQYLLDNDSQNEDISVVKKSIGSKIDYVQLVKKLMRDKNVEIEYYNRELLDIISSRQDEVKPRFIKDLESIAEKTNDCELKKKILEAEQEINKLRADNENKEKELVKERVRREKAEKAAKEANAAKDAAEKMVKEKDKEKQQTENALKQKTKQNLFLQSVQTLDIDKILNYHHDIGVQATAIENWLKIITGSINRGNIDIDEIKETIEAITISNNKILAIAHFATKANFNSSAENISVDIVTYIEQYVESVQGFFDGIKIHFTNKNHIELKKKFKPIQVSVMLDNLFNNSMKAKAKNFCIEISKTSNKEIEILFTDDGLGLVKDIVNPQEIFEKGYTTTNGSGLGLYHVFLIVKDELKGSVKVNDGIKHGFQIKVVLKIESII
jgi:signal transduction histidine kinase